MIKQLMKIFLLSLLSFNIIISGIVISTQSCAEAVSSLQEVPVISIDPANITAGVGEQFNISVRVDNVTGLYGLGLTFRWGVEVLDYVSHVITVPVETYPNGVLHTPTLLVKNDTERADILGIYELGVSSLGPKSFNGSGTIFNMTFQVLMEGECYFYVQDSELSDKSADPIDHETVDGYFYRPGLGEVPIADFTVTPDVLASTPEPDIIANKTATFNASASRDPDGGNIVLYIWDFGDGTVNRTADPIINHTYPSQVDMPFEVFVELSVLDDQGGGSQSKAKRQKLRVILPNPVADFEFWPGTAPGTVLGPAVIGNNVRFNASASYDPDPGGSVINYTWNFDDGSLMVTNDTIVTHNYTSLPALVDAMGKYYFVKLRVYDIENLVSTETEKKVYLVSRRDVEVMDVTVSPSEFLQGEDVTINVTIANRGHAKEFFNITAYYNATSTTWAEIKQLRVKEGFPGQNETLQGKVEPIRWELSYHLSNSNPINARAHKFIEGSSSANDGTIVGIGDATGYWTINPSKLNDATSNLSLVAGVPLTTGGWAFEESDGSPLILNGDFSNGNWSFFFMLYATEEVDATIWVRVLKSDNPNPQADGANITILKDWTSVNSTQSLPTSATVFSGNVAMPSATFTNEHLYFEFQLQVTENLAGSTTQVVFQLGGAAASRPGIKPTTFTEHKQYSLYWDTAFTPKGNYVIKVVTSEVPHETDLTNNEALSGSVTIEELQGVQPLQVIVDVGTIHFRGEIAEFYILTSSSGKRVNASFTAFLLFDRTITQLNLTEIDPLASDPVTTGVYLIRYPIPVDALPGAYMLVVDASRLILELDFTQQGTGIGGFLISSTFSGWNATLAGIEDNIATIITDVGEIKANLTAINATLSGLLTEVKGDILATINTTLGQVITRLDNINVTVTDIKGSTLTINSTLGEAQASLGAIQSSITIGLAVASVLSAIAAIVAIVILLRVRKLSK